MELILLNQLRKLNHWTAVAIGACLAVCTGFILLDIVLRKVGSSFGGSEEISGYVMAIITSWGMSYTLLELSHVRIDFLRSKFNSRGRVLMDLISMSALTATICFIAYRAWPVVERSLVNDAHANTVLETPLALVQIPWFAGWVWFALISITTLFIAFSLALKNQLTSAEEIIGLFEEGQQES